MPIASARAFLRGLPIEQKEEVTTVTTNTDPRAARLAEIEGSMKAFKHFAGPRWQGEGRNRLPRASIR